MSNISMVISKSMKNIGPEKEVESQVIAWAFSKRWSLDVFDSKMIFVGGHGKSNSGIPLGCSDLVGNTDDGIAAYIELKEPNKDGVCRLSQRQFLEKKIDSNAFACVVSSVAMLEEIFRKWKSLSGKEARDFLRSQLPNKVIVGKKVVQLSK